VFSPLDLDLALSLQNNERHFVQHDYHDHALETDDYHQHDGMDDDDHQDDDDSSSMNGGSGQDRDHHHENESTPSSSSASADGTTTKKRRRGGVSVSFPTKLHAVLEQMEADGLEHVLSWQSHGRCFKIHKPTEFAEYVMPSYFRQSKLTSFQRQLNLVRCLDPSVAPLFRLRGCALLAFFFYFSDTSCCCFSFHLIISVRFQPPDEGYGCWVILP
jgi:HSF-type DNA-binding